MTDKDRLLTFGLDPDNFPKSGFTKAKAHGVGRDAYITAFGLAFTTAQGEPVFVVDRYHRPLAVFWEDTPADCLEWSPFRTGWPLFHGVAVYHDTGEQAILKPRSEYSVDELEYATEANPHTVMRAPWWVAMQEARAVTA